MLHILIESINQRKKRQTRKVVQVWEKDSCKDDAGPDLWEKAEVFGGKDTDWVRVDFFSI
jgi:hypothetical protein